MKRYIQELPVVIEVDVETYHPIFDLLDDAEIAASVDLSTTKLPNGQVIAKEKERVIQQMKDDFEAFMDTVESLCEHNFHLVGTYKNVSDDDSYYYNYLATDEHGNIIVDYRMRLRISNHTPKRSPAQKANKNSELNSERLHQLLSLDEIEKLKDYTLYITVNDTVFTSYDVAISYIFHRLDHAVKIMTANKKHRSKKSIPRDLKN